MCNMDIVLVWVCCKESRCQFLVIQAFRDMPGSHVGAPPEAATSSPPPSTATWRRCATSSARSPARPRRRTAATASAAPRRRVWRRRPGTDDFSKASPRCTGRRAPATRRSAGCSWRPGPRPRRRTTSARGLSGSGLRGLVVGTAPLGRGRTPLYVAAEYGRTEAVQALLEANASVAATDNYGRGAFDWTGDVDFGAPGVVRTPLKTVDALIWRFQFQENSVECSLEGLRFCILRLLQSHSFMNYFDLLNA